MLKISIRDNENNRWNRNFKKKKQKKQNETKKANKDRKEQEGAEAIVKEWELNDFVVHLRQVFSN